jgi:hypothetical protein
MGGTWVPAFASAVSTTICELVTLKVKEQYPDADFKFRSWVDNFFCFAKRKKVAEAVRKEFKMLCEKLNCPITLDEVTRDMKLLGLLFNFKSRSVHLTDEVKIKLQEAIHEIEARDTALTSREVITYFGKANFINYALRRAPLCFEPEVMDMVRTVCREQRWDEPVPAGTSSIEALAGLLRKSVEAFIDRSLVSDPDRPANGRIAWSDASNTHIAGVLQDDMIDVAQWSMPRLDANAPESRIFLWELIAWAAGAMVWEGEAPGTCAIDNTAALRAVINGHSGSRSGDAVLRCALPHCRHRPSMAWVSTKEQRADKLTRPHDPAVESIAPMRLAPDRAQQPKWFRAEL